MNNNYNNNNQITNSSYSTPESQFKNALQVLERSFQDQKTQQKQETERFHKVIRDRDAEIHSLKEKVSTFRYELEQKGIQINQLADEKSELMRENQQMSMQMKKTARELSKLQNFKQAIVQSLHTQDDSSDNVGIEEQFSAALEDPSTSSYSPQQQQEQRPPQRYNPSQQGIRLEGMDFFRRAREELSPEQFSEFRGCIRRLNEHVITRSQALSMARDIFGGKKHDLFISFKNLIDRLHP
eukprot:gb/GECH01011130.1/.p1 GENE.gb/GECH01011130.1/~~gb/GECH01011130.1/.p1  ORF type:complete len:240 (+),score=61.74 gb/GECH01011130.1/:1-720(+)